VRLWQCSPWISGAGFHCVDKVAVSAAQYERAMFVSFDIHKAAAYWCSAQYVIQTLGSSCSQRKSTTKTAHQLRRLQLRSTC
jgi:hypothetical protein